MTDCQQTTHIVECFLFPKSAIANTQSWKFSTFNKTLFCSTLFKYWMLYRCEENDNNAKNVSMQRFRFLLWSAKKLHAVCEIPNWSTRINQCWLQRWVVSPLYFCDPPSIRALFLDFITLWSSSSPPTFSSSWICPKTTGREVIDQALYLSFSRAKTIEIASGYIWI